MFRTVPLRPLAVAALFVAAPVLAQVNGPGQVYATSPRAAGSVTGGYVAPSPAAVPPAVVVVPAQAQAYGPVRGQRPPAIQTAPNVVLGWGGLPPSGGHPPPGYAAPGYVVPGHGYPPPQPGVLYGGQVYPATPYGQPAPQPAPQYAPQYAPPPVYYPAPYR